MPLKSSVKAVVESKIEQYEGRVNHLYLDSKGRVTVGVGHLISNRIAVRSVKLYKTKNGIPAQMASLSEKHVEYDKVSKLAHGARYGARSFKAHTSLVMKNADIDSQRDKHISSFYSELSNIYQKSKGYTHNFDNLPKEVQLALFDMIFNLGATKLINTFTNFNVALKAGDWKKAAAESNRPDVNTLRNQYVKQLFNSILPSQQPITTP